MRFVYTLWIGAFFVHQNVKCVKTLIIMCAWCIQIHIHMLLLWPFLCICICIYIYIAFCWLHISFSIWFVCVVSHRFALLYIYMCVCMCCAHGKIDTYTNINWFANLVMEFFPSLSLSLTPALIWYLISITFQWHGLNFVACKEILINQMAETLRINQKFIIWMRICIMSRISIVSTYECVCVCIQRYTLTPVWKVYWLRESV